MSEARTRLYQLVDAAAGDEGEVVVIAKRDAKSRHTYRAALVPVARLDEAGRARLGSWPSWARTAARPKLGDLVVEAGDSPARPGVPQVLLDRTTPLAVLVEASLVPPGDAPVAVPGDAPAPAAAPEAAGSAEAAQLPSAAPGTPEDRAVPVNGPGMSAAAPGAVQGTSAAAHEAGADAGTEESVPRWAGLWPMSLPKSIDELRRSADVVDEEADAAAAEAAAGASGHVPAAGGGDPQGAGRRVAEQDSDGGGIEGGDDQAADGEPEGAEVAADEEALGVQASAGSAAPASVPAGGGGRRRLHGLGEVAGLALTEAVMPSAVPRFGFGLRALDAALGSLPRGVLTVVAADPHAGGSLLAVHAARHMALTHQLPVLYAASGLSRTDVAMRVIAAEAELDYRRLRAGALTADEQQAAAKVQARLAVAALHIDDGSGLTAEAVAETAPYVDGLALVVVDRLQHAADPFIPLSGPALPEAARVLAHLARSRGVPVVAVLDTTEAAVLAELDAAHLVLTLTRTGDQGEVVVAERDFGELTRVRLCADLARARFTDPPAGPRDAKAASAFEGAEGEKVTADLVDAARPYLEPGLREQLPDSLREVLPALVGHFHARRAGDEWTGAYLSSSQAAVYAAWTRDPDLPETGPADRLEQALEAFCGHAAAHGYRPSGLSTPGLPFAAAAAPHRLPADSAPSTPPAPAGPPTTTSSAAEDAALQPAPAPTGEPAVPVAAGEGVAAVEAELLDAALPFTSGARHGLSARLTGALAALREASTVPGREGELPGLRLALADLAARRPAMPPTPEGGRLGEALAAFTAAHRGDTPTTPAAATPATSTSAPPPWAAGASETGPAHVPAGTLDLAAAEAELLAAAAPLLTGNEHRSPLSVQAQHVLTALRDALAPGNDHLLPAARARAAELATRRLRLPATDDAARLRAALTAYHAAATAAGITPSALPTPGPADVTGPVRPVTPAPVPPTASLTVTEPAPAAEFATAARAAEASAAEPVAAVEAPGTAPGTAGDAEAAQDAQGADLARKAVEGVVLEAPSASFRDDTPPPEGTPGTGTGSGNRNYSFFLNKIRDAVEQALDESDGDIEAAVKTLKKKAVPDSMALFKLTRVGGNYVHTVYPPALDFLSKPGQGEADGIWEGRHKWRNAPLYEAIKRGERHPLDVVGLDINAAYLSAFKTHLPIGALKHDPTGGFDRRKAGIHRVDQFEWPHTHLPSPIGNRIEPGPYLLDEATVRLLIRCSELGLSEPPRILESWTSGASEALLEKFRRVLQQARQQAIETEDTVTEEYVKAMYSRFTSTIGESGKNRELRRPEWVHTIRSQAFASLWLRAWKAHQAGLILVQVSGVDELHVAGGDWKNVWEEGRKPTQMKVKRLYTLGETK
ncbi:DnaB-like helicase C-terminal domain-containing protein [Streptomyces griseoincarnatus]